MAHYGKDMKKPEHMTSLSGNRMVSKTHGRIVFRGLIDTLEAEVIEAQVLASERGSGELCANLGEVLDYLREIMAAEVKEIPLPPPCLFGMDAEEIHRQSHSMEGFRPSPKNLHQEEVYLPHYTHGALAARINTLRAKVREVELCAVRVFCPEEGPERGDIILALNRLSSALWWLFCHHTFRYH